MQHDDLMQLPPSDLLAALSRLPRTQLVRLLLRLEESRHSLLQTDGTPEAGALVRVEFCMGDAFACLGKHSQAFTFWETSLDHGFASSVATIGDVTIANLVAARRRQFRSSSNPRQKPQLLLFGPGALACAPWADIVHVWPTRAVEKVAWDETNSRIAYDWTTCTLDDILDLLPSGWVPECAIVSNLEKVPLPAGFESLEIPRIGWVGDLIQHFREIADCLPVFDLLIVDQHRDVEFAKAYGISNVAWVLLGSQQAQAPSETEPLENRGVDVAFFGTVDGPRIYSLRRKVLARIRDLERKYNVVIRDNIESHQRMLDVLSQAKIGVNIDASWSGRWKKHPYTAHCARRIYEITSMGALCLTSETTPDVAAQYVLDEEIVRFTLENVVDKIEHYLEHPTEAARIADAGRARTFRYNTVSHRMRDVVGLALAVTRGASQGAPTVAVLRQQLVSGLAVYRPESHLRDAALPANALGCIAAIDSPAVQDESPTVADVERYFDRAMAEEPTNVICRFNAMAHAVRSTDWPRAATIAGELLVLAEGDLGAADLAGWARPDVYPGESRPVSWWRGDLCHEFAVAYYADPTVRADFAGVMRSYLRVAIRDHIACLSYLQGRRDDARRNWEDAYDLDNEDEYVSARLAEYWFVEGEFGHALTWTRRAEAIRPFNARNAVLMALIAERTDRHEDAVGVYPSLGYKGIQSRDEAIEWYKSTSELFPVPSFIS